MEKRACLVKSVSSRWLPTRCVREAWQSFTAVALFATLALQSAELHARERALDAVPLAANKLRLDGMIKEWPALVPLNVRHKGSDKSGETLKAEAGLGYDDKNLYVALRVNDAHITRSAKGGKADDHATLLITFPKAGGGQRAYEVELYPGVAGSIAGAVKQGGQAISGAKLIEYSDGETLSFEAVVPWKTFAEADRVRSGLRGGLRYQDADSGSVLSHISANALSNAPITIEAEFALREELASRFGVRTEPRLSQVGNVVGGPMLEQVAVFERYLALTGWDYRKGMEFFYQDLQVASAKDVKRLELADLTADGHTEVIVERVLRDAGVGRQYYEVWQFRDETKGPELIFQHEMGVESGASKVYDRVELKRVGSQCDILISQGDSKADHVDPAHWDIDLRSGETVPLLLPWQAVESRQYHFQAGRFALSEEKSGKPKMAAPSSAQHAGTGQPAGARLWSGKEPPAAASAAASSSQPEARNETARSDKATFSSSQDMQEQVYGLYRTEHGKGSEKARFDLSANLVGDETPERVLVHGRDLVVLGKRFKAGSSYEYTSLVFAEPADLTKVETRDVTGDGRAEILVHGVVRAKASKQLGGETVMRHALFVYAVKETGISRIFGAEIGRSLGDKRINSELRFSKDGIDLSAGDAKGWTQATYPFPVDRAPYGGLEPLLVPWGDVKVKHYRLRDGQFKAE